MNLNPEVTATIWNIPYKRNPFFTGREEILDQLHDTFFKEVKTRSPKLPQALSGLGGAGKTQTAIEYAYRYRDEYQTVLWVRAETPNVLIADYITLASQLNLTEKDRKEQSLVVDSVKDWLNRHFDWLLILDNVEDLDMITDYIPTENKGHILLTTRAQAMSGIATPVKIEAMEPEEGALLLLRRANIVAQDAFLDEASDADLNKAEEISRSMGGLPLGLDQAGAYIDETGLGLSGYLELYQSQQKELLKRRGRHIAGHPEPVAATWTISFERVQQANVAAADLLRLCAFLYPDTIPEEIISKGLSEISPNLYSIAHNPIKLNEAIEELLRFSLVGRDPHTNSLTIHRLVQAALKDELTEDMQYQWAKSAVQAVNRVFPNVEFTTWSRCQLYLPHALVCKALIEEWDMVFPEAAQLLYNVGHYLWVRGQFTQAEPHLERALAIREKVLGPDDLDVAQTLNLLGIVYGEQDKYAQEEPLIQRALSIREKVLSQDNPKVAESLNDLGMTYYAVGKFVQAQTLLQRAVAIREKVLGLEHPDTAGSLSMVAATIDDPTEAETLLRQSLKIREKTIGREHPDTANTLQLLALALYKQSKYVQAKAFVQRALAMREKLLGPKHRDVAASLVVLGVIYRTQHNYIKAEPLLRRALAIREKALGLEHPDTADSLESLGKLYLAEGNYVKAEPFYQRALTIYEKVFGAEYLHPDFVNSLTNYVYILKHTKRKSEAAELEARVEKIKHSNQGGITTYSELSD